MLIKQIEKQKGEDKISLNDYSEVSQLFYFLKETEN